MKTVLLALIVVFTGFYVNAQTTPGAFLNKAPALPKDSCGITRAAMESFTRNVNALIDLVDEEINSLNDKIDAQAPTNEAAAKKAAMQQMSQQYNFSPEEMSKMQAGKMSAADKQAMADKILQQQANMSMDEVKNLSKMDEAGKKAYSEAYATELMANSQANPKPQTGNSAAQNSYQLLNEQQDLLGKISAASQEIGRMYAAVESDPSGQEMLKKIDDWHNKLMSMTGIDYGQGKQMDSLSTLIKNEQIKYCNKFTPAYRAAIRNHLSNIKASLPDYQRMGEITAEITKVQTGIVPPPESAQIGGMQAVKEYLGKLQTAYKFNLYFADDNQ